MVRSIPDMVLCNGEIISMDKKGAGYDALAIRDGNITAVGDNESIREMRGFGTEEIDLEGQTLIPGFIDTSVHVIQTGLGTLGINLSKVKSREDILALIRKAAANTPASQFIWGFYYDDSEFSHSNPITRWDLDEITTAHQVWLNGIEYHTVVVNSYALHMLHLPWNAEGIDRDEKELPTGIFKEKSSAMARKRFFELFVDDRLRARALERVAKDALKVGITAVHAMEGGYLFHDKDAEFVHTNGNNVPVDIVLYYQTTDIAKVKAMGLPRIGGTLFLDGSLRSRTAALFEPYTDDPGNHGQLHFTQEELNSFVLEAHTSGLQVAVFALGERAIEQVLNAYDSVLKLWPIKNHRHRIESFELPTAEQIKRAAGLGIVISTQPADVRTWGGPDGMYAKRLGDRINRADPYRQIIDAGLILTGSSESDITPMDPLYGIFSAVNHYNPAFAITPLEALKMFTTNGAYSCFREKDAGSIEAGKVADLAVLSKNPLKVDKESLNEIKVKMTIKNGNVLFAR